MKKRAKVNLISFGFKYGLPNANYYFDVGFINHEIGYASCIYKDDIDRVRKEVLDAGKMVGCDFFKHQPYRIITKNNDIRWVLDYTIIVRGNKNNIKQYIGHVSDITDLRKKEEQMLKSEKLASMG